MSTANHSNNEEDNIGHGFSKRLFAGRMQLDPVIKRSSHFNPYRSAQLVNMKYLNDKDKVAVINETLRKTQKMMLEDVFVSDATVRRCITLFVKFLMGKRTETVLDIKKEFMTPAMQEQVLASTFKKPELDKLKTKFDEINRVVKFREKVEGAVIQAKVGGRSVLKIEQEAGEGTQPSDLKLLNWGKLGRVFADKDSWQMLAVEYADRPRDEPLLAEEIIYFPWQDYNISPDSLYMGNSAVLPVADIAETIRKIVSENLKEAADVSLGDAGLFKFPPNTSRANMEEFVNDVVAGRWYATSSDVEAQTFGLKPEIEKMMQVVTEGRMMIIEGLGIPDYLITSKNVPNRAVADLAMNVWRESDLNHARSWLQGIIEPQWFDSLLMIEHPDIDIDTMQIKAKLEFEDITYETLKDRAETIIILYEKGLITLEKALKILDMEDVLEQIQAQQKLLQQQRKEELEMMRLEREEALANGNGNGNGNGRGARRIADGEEDEEEEDEEETTPIRARTRQASFALPDGTKISTTPSNVVTKEDWEKGKQELLAKLVQASESTKQEQSRIQIQNNRESELQQLQMKLMEEEHRARMNAIKQQEQAGIEQQKLVDRVKSRIAVLEQKTKIE